MHQEIFDSLGLAIEAKLIGVEGSSQGTMFVNLNTSDKIYYRSKDWCLPMTSGMEERFIYNLYHEYLHLLQILDGNPSALIAMDSSSPHPNYSMVNKAEEEAEAFALLMSKGVGATKHYFWDSIEKVEWILMMHSTLTSKYNIDLPDPQWANQKYQAYLKKTTPPPMPGF